MRLITKIVGSILKRSDLPVEDRSYLSTFLLEKLGAFPIRDIISVNDEGSLIVDGRSLDVDQARALREGAKLAKTNVALKLIREQVLYAAVTTGIHKSETELQLFFSRAAIWWGQQEERLLALLSQGDSGTEE